MKKKLFIIFLILCHLTNAQYITISGKVEERIDHFNKKSKLKKNEFTLADLPYAKFQVYTSSDTIVRGVCDQQGYFNLKFDIKPDKIYYLKFYKEEFFPKISEINTKGCPTEGWYEFVEWNLGLRRALYDVTSGQDIINKPFEKLYYDQKNKKFDYDIDYGLTYLDELETVVYSEIEKEVEQVAIAQNTTADKIDIKSNIKNNDDHDNDKEREKIINEAKSTAAKIIEDAENEATAIIQSSQIKAKKDAEIYLTQQKLLTQIEEDNFIKNYERNQLIKNSDIQTSNSNIADKKIRLLNEKQQLEIEKLKAKTKEDSLAISLKEELIKNIEQDILFAEQKLAYQEQEIQLKSLEVKNQRNIISLFIIVILAVILISFVLYYNFRTKKKLNIILQEQNKIIEEKNKNVLSSIKYAKRIQEAILPENTFCNMHLKNHFILYMPKDIVSGDFYWVNKVDNKVLFAAIDCTGHGVPGAFMSIVCYHSLNRAVNELKITQPSAILDNVHQNINSTLRQTYKESTVKDGMDIALCSIEFKENSEAVLEYAGAYNPLFVMRNGEIETIEANKQPVGSFLDDKHHSHFTNHIINLKKGDAVYVFTDGYTDQFGGHQNRKITKIGFKKLILSMAQKEMSAQKDELKEYFNRWIKAANEEQIDDVCIIGVRI